MCFLNCEKIITLCSYYHDIWHIFKVLEKKAFLNKDACLEKYRGLCFIKLDVKLAHLAHSATIFVDRIKEGKAGWGLSPFRILLTWAASVSQKTGGI